MNFMQLLKSLDELLFEVMSWLVFFPVTLWRTLTQPLATMDYADRELHDRAEQQYTDTLSPPLFLLLALLLSHGLALALGDGDNSIIANTRGLDNLVNDDKTLLMLRLVIFSLIPMALAASLMVAKKEHLTRAKLKIPFYAQCYPAAAYAVLVGLAGLMIQSHRINIEIAGLGLLFLFTFAYLVLQILWFRRKLGALWPAIFYAGTGFCGGVAVAVGIAKLFA